MDPFVECVNPDVEVGDLEVQVREHNVRRTDGDPSFLQHGVTSHVVRHHACVLVEVLGAGVPVVTTRLDNHVDVQTRRLDLDVLCGHRNRYFLERTDRVVTGRRADRGRVRHVTTVDVVAVVAPFRTPSANTCGLLTGVTAANVEARDNTRDMVQHSCPKTGRRRRLVDQVGSHLSHDCRTLDVHERALARHRDGLFDRRQIHRHFKVNDTVGLNVQTLTDYGCETVHCECGGVASARIQPREASLTTEPGVLGLLANRPADNHHDTRQRSAIRIDGAHSCESGSCVLGKCATRKAHRKSKSKRHYEKALPAFGKHHASNLHVVSPAYRTATGEFEFRGIIEQITCQMPIFATNLTISHIRR